jgi:hypothetical protein
VIASRHGRRPYILRILRILTTVGVATALVAGCTSGSSSSSATGSTPVTVGGSVTSVSLAPSPSPSPSPSLAPPVLPAAAKQPTQAGAEAFYRYFWDVYSYSYAGLDTSILKAVSILPECTYCAAVAKNIETAQSMNLRYSGGRVKVDLTVAAPGKPTDGLLINGLIDQASSVATSSSASSETFPPKVKVSADAVARWLDGQWAMAEVKVAKSR